MIVRTLVQILQMASTHFFLALLRIETRFASNICLALYIDYIKHFILQMGKAFKARGKNTFDWLRILFGLNSIPKIRVVRVWARLALLHWISMGNIAAAQKEVVCLDAFDKKTIFHFVRKRLVKKKIVRKRFYRSPSRTSSSTKTVAGE